MVEPRVLPACRRLGVLGPGAVQPAGPRLPRRGSVRSGRRPRRGRLPPPATRASRRPAWRRTGAWPRPSPSWRRAAGRTPAQGAWRWPGRWRQGEDIVPIPGTKRVRYLEDNVAGGGIELDADAARRARAPASPATAVQGARYGEAVMRMVDRDP
ncbi:MAG: hypothetical protein U5K43_00970 [Halofilum sp. (in: g-proteobacteria)]|nr:hypothetical protein [Halofilum sp. (in: g-proteobacteria)]